MLPGVARARELNGGLPHRWQRVLPTIVKTERVSDIKPVIYAIISTWNDFDVIGATVRNCFAQGCQKVFLLDNASTDNTVEVAVAAGAHVARIYETDHYDDDWRITLQNQIIRDETERSGLDDLWWFALDSDEFPIGADGSRVEDLLTGIPGNIRVVGSNFIDLYPTREYPYENNCHPATKMRYGIWRRGGINKYCACHHWKHLCVRHLKGQQELHQIRGNHTVGLPPPFDSSLVPEPDFDIVCFHAPIRRQAETTARLQALCLTRSSTVGKSSG